jgi:hypothetical protein
MQRSQVVIRISAGPDFVEITAIYGDRVADKIKISGKQFDAILHGARTGRNGILDAIDRWLDSHLLKCKECGLEFYPSSGHKRKFCSTKCAHKKTNREWRRRDLKGKKCTGARA